MRSQLGTSGKWGGIRYPPFAFTEQGVAMLSSVLTSQFQLSGVGTQYEKNTSP